MQFSQSLKFNHVFQRLYHRGARAANRDLALYCRRNGRDCNRVGITVGAKTGHAVVRNRIRRRLREIYRLHENQFRPGMDIVVVARASAAGASYAALERSYLSLARRLGLLCGEDAP